ncbi:MAG: 16S rRNA (cytidine(1402)-2'-O)-methyltransferase [Acidobacteria bacterium]|nr:MAG: 16S rRNA (cytidine(1402)-2'-O)-methyltransferase [Acidobacteriota bacterium]
MDGTLYLVGTPIGNLKDISLRALETLAEVDLIACEDTRNTRKLLNHYGIKGKKLISYHEHNEEQRAEELINHLLAGKSIALVSDAGMPAISDPGYKIVKKTRQTGLRLVVIPGPIAFISALLISGLPTDTIFFAGFLPSKKSDRRKYLEKIKYIPATLCFYEAPHRLASSLRDCLQILGNRKAAVVREITKIHEEVIDGSLHELIEKPMTLKGEIVLLIDRANEDQCFFIEESEALEKEICKYVNSLEESGIDRKKAMKEAAKKFNIRKSEVYKMLQRVKSCSDR